MALRAWFITCVALCSVSAQAETTCSQEHPSPECTNQAEMHVSLASGPGFRSNPLHGGHNFPLWLMADVHYYGESFFFDNGTFGYTLPTNTDWSLSVVTRLNDEKSYFRRATPISFFENQVISDKGLLGPVERFAAKKELSIDDVAKRPWALDAGLQLDMFGEAWHSSVNYWHDVNGAYHGSHARVAASYHWDTSSGRWTLGSALHWKSRQLIDTYYGASAAEWNDTALVGQADLQPELSLQWQMELTERWSMMSLVRYRWLDLQVKDESGETLRSPLQQDSQVRSIFLGFSYRFI